MCLLLIGIASGRTSNSSHFIPDVVFYVLGRPVEAHRVILSARSAFFRKKFETEWKERKEVRFSKEKLSYPALFSLIHFFYSDRLEVAVDDMEDLVRICKVCKCGSLQRMIEKELIHQRHAEYKALRDVDNSVKRFILQGVSLPEEDRLPAALHRILQVSLGKAYELSEQDSSVNRLLFHIGELHISNSMDDLADICVKVDKKIFRCHKVLLASRSEYFKTRLSRMTDFYEGKDVLLHDSLPCLEEHDLSAEAFEKMVEFM